MVVPTKHHFFPFCLCSGNAGVVSIHFCYSFSFFLSQPKSSKHTVTGGVSCFTENIPPLSNGVRILYMILLKIFIVTSFRIKYMQIVLRVEDIKLSSLSSATGLGERISFQLGRLRCIRGLQEQRSRHLPKLHGLHTYKDRSQVCSSWKSEWAAC